MRTIVLAGKQVLYAAHTKGARGCGNLTRWPGGVVNSCRVFLALR